MFAHEGEFTSYSDRQTRNLQPNAKTRLSIFDPAPPPVGDKALGNTSVCATCMYAPKSLAIQNMGNDNDIMMNMHPEIRTIGIQANFLSCNLEVEETSFDISPLY